MIPKYKLCLFCYRDIFNLAKSKSPRVSMLNRKVKQFGEEFLDDLHALETRPFFTLTDFGNKYGLSRERIRQIYFKLSRKNFRAVRGKKSRKIREETKSLGCVNDPRYKFAEYKCGKNNVRKGAKAEKLFYDECINRGFLVSILCDRGIDIKVNGYLIDVKSCYKSRLLPGAKTKRMYFAFSEKQRDEADFLVCYSHELGCFYIIPKKEFLSGGLSLSIPIKEDGYHNCKNRYKQYKEAWHLLKQ